jgi:Cysteine dioxygenase type I
VFRPDALVPALPIGGRSASPDSTAERLAHPAGRGRPPQALGAEAMQLIAAGLAQSSPRVDHAWTPGTRRRYTRLLDTALYDAWLIEWLPSSCLELHDHGHSRGAVVVAAGSLVEIYTDLQARHPLRTKVRDCGDRFTISRSRVHQLSNPGPAVALSVHVYSPPLMAMTFYDHCPSSYLTPLYTNQGDLVLLEEAAT